MPFLLWALKIVWDTNITSELRDALKDWMAIKRQVGVIFKNRNHVQHKPLYDALRYFFIGSSIAKLTKFGVLISSVLFLLLVGINIYHISFWQTGTFNLDEFRNLFSLIVFFGILVFTSMVVIRMGINFGNKIRKTEHARIEE